MKFRFLLSTCAALLALGLMQAAPALAATGPGVAWQPAAADADIERAFTQARGEKKPLLLYWGASWCPPCNRLKSTLFNRQDFIELSQAFVAVNVDGDLPGAQKLGTRFKVRGYPTVILFSPEGQEITRLPGEADAPQVIRVLQLGLSGGRPAKVVLSEARAGKKLSANDWRMLGFYSWELDEDQLLPAAERPALLAELALASKGVDDETTTRLWLKALANSDDGKGVKPDQALRSLVGKVLTDKSMARSHMDVLTNGATNITKALSTADTAERKILLTQFEKTLKELTSDRTLSRADRLGALLARVELARIDAPKAEMQPKLPAALASEVQSHIAKDDREIKDGHERQAVITAAAYVLGQAGLWKESDALLKSSLSKSISPYYLMSQLGGNARKQGRKDEALKWYEQAFNKSEGPATRLQWGAGYLSALVDLAPTDATRIESTVAQLLNEAAQDRGSFYERSARSLQRVGSKLESWNAQGQHAPTMARLKAQLDGICAKVEQVDKQRATCEGLIKAPGGKG